MENLLKLLKPSGRPRVSWGVKGWISQVFILSKLDSCGCRLAWVHRVPIVVFIRVIIGLGVCILTFFSVISDLGLSGNWKKARLLHLGY